MIVRLYDADVSSAISAALLDVFNALDLMDNTTFLKVGTTKYCPSCHVIH